MSAKIHPTAFVSSNAKIGKNVSIGQCALIEDDVVIGDNCVIHPFASVKQFTKMADNNQIHSYALVGGAPQDLKFSGEESWVEIGSGNTIREFATIHRGTSGGGCLTKIGNNNLLMAYTHIAHDCLLGSNIVMSNNATLAGHVRVDDGAILGGLSAVHQFVHIGKHSFLGGMSGIAQDLPPYMLAVGVRGGVHGPNVVGLRRLGLGSSALSAIRNAYKLIWFSDMPRNEALDKVLADFGDMPEVNELVNFIKSSEKGVLGVNKSGGYRE